MQIPNIMVILKIAELYPDRLVCIAIEDEDQHMWSAALINGTGNIMGETVYCFEGYTYDTSDNALKAMDNFLRITIDSVKVMSN